MKENIFSSVGLNKSEQESISIDFPKKLDFFESKGLKIETIENKLREYIFSLLKKLIKKTQFSHLDLNSPLILFNEKESLGGSIHYKPDAIRGNLFYTIEICLGINNESTKEVLVEVNKYLDYLIIHEFCHPLIGNGYMDFDIKNGVSINKNKYQVNIPPSSLPSDIEFKEDYEYGIKEGPIDKFAFKLGGDRTKEAYLEFSKKLLVEENEITERAFCLLINHANVLQQINEDALAQKFIEKINSSFGKETYFYRLNIILENYKIYYENSLIKTK